MNEAILSPDGRAVAFTSPISGFDQVFVMLASGGDPLQLTNDSVDKAVDSFSIDGTQIFYEAADEVRAVATLGGPSARLVGGARLVPSPTDDFFFFLNPRSDGVYRKPKTGLGDELIFDAAAKEGMLITRIWPYPDGKELLVAGKASELAPSTLTLFKVNAVTHAAQRAGELPGNPSRHRVGSAGQELVSQPHKRRRHKYLGIQLIRQWLQASYIRGRSRPVSDARPCRKRNLLCKRQANRCSSRVAYQQKTIR